MHYIAIGLLVIIAAAGAFFFSRPSETLTETPTPVSTSTDSTNTTETAVPTPVVTTPQPTPTPTPVPKPTPTPTPSPTATTYTDGSYSQSVTYRSPDGTDGLTVALTIASDKVTAVTVTGVPSNGTSRNYQSRFAGEISGKIVGKKVDDIAIDNLSGASLTTRAFNNALTQIKLKAS